MRKYIVIFILLFFNKCFSQINLSQGLIAYYPFNGNANDISGNNNNPVFNNATLTTDRFGNANSAYYFNGTSSYIQIPNSVSLNPTSQISLCAWVKVEGFYPGPCRGTSILMKGNTEDPPTYKLRIDENSYPGNYSCGQFTDTTHEFFYGQGLGVVKDFNFPWIKKNQWYNIIYTYDGITANLYVDCKLVKTSAVQLDLVNAEDLFIGKANISPNYPFWFNGVLDEIKIYNRALTAEEINASLNTIKTSGDTAICKNSSVHLFANGGLSYLWSPSSSLNNPTEANPIASPQSTTIYSVSVIDSNNCNVIDSIKITVNPASVFTISPDQNICKNDSKQLFASGGDYYLWQPALSINNPNIAHPVATPDINTTYSVKIKNSACHDSTMLTTTIAVLQLPVIKASKTNNIDCSNNFSQLSVTGGNKYIWQPGISLGDSTISNPIAKPTATTLYYVKVTGANGCSIFDTVTVNVDLNFLGNYNLPNAFTPNNDGLNDCFGLKYWGNVSGLDFSVYNSFGQRIFHTTDASKCWDGTYKGILQNTGIYVYFIKFKNNCASINRKGEVLLIR